MQLTMQIYAIRNLQIEFLRYKDLKNSANVCISYLKSYTFCSYLLDLINT